MLKPRFSIRTYLIAAALFAFVGIPAGYQYLKSRQQRAEVIPVLNTEAQTVADVLRAVYLDPAQIGATSKPRQSNAAPLEIAVDTQSNKVIVSGPRDLIPEVRELISAIDTPPSNSDQVIGRDLPLADAETIQGLLRRILDESPQ